MPCRVRTTATGRGAKLTNAPQFCGVVSSAPYTAVVDETAPMDSIPEWFAGARLSLAENLLRCAKTTPSAWGPPPGLYCGG